MILPALYLLPFINTFVLFICIEEGQLFHNVYRWFSENIAPKLPLPYAILGGCVLCSSWWLGASELTATFLWHKFALVNWLFLGYNAVTTTILYRLLK